MDLSRFKKDSDYEVKLPKIEDVVSSEIYYFDEKGNFTDEKNAKRFIGKAFDKDGNMINETFGECNNGNNMQDGHISF